MNLSKIAFNTTIVLAVITAILCFTGYTQELLYFYNYGIKHSMFISDTSTLILKGGKCFLYVVINNSMTVIAYLSVFLAGKYLACSQAEYVKKYRELLTSKQFAKQIIFKFVIIAYFIALSFQYIYAVGDMAKSSTFSNHVPFYKYILTYKDKEKEPIAGIVVGYKNGLYAFIEKDNTIENATKKVHIIHQNDILEITIVNMLKR